MGKPVIIETVDAPKFYGNTAVMLESKEQEVILTGPYETGKTFATLTKMHLLLCLFPKARGLLLRRTYKSLINSGIVTYEQKVLPLPPDHPRSPVKKFGGEWPEFYRYPNGSRLIIGGLDNPDKVLSAEYDFINVIQAEEVAIDAWEKLTGRATGRAGNAPFTQVMGDCNPGTPTHWIKQRPTVQLLETRHEDNPRLFDHATGEWTERGRKTLKILDALTGVRYKRGRLGLWVAAEGQIYEYDPVVHLTKRFTIPPTWRRFRVVDFGFTNPFVCQWWAIDPDGRMFRYREIYMTGRTVRRHADQIKMLSAGESIETTICDHDAEDRATLEENGIPTRAADKRVSVGIEQVQERIAKAGDGKPRLYFLEDSLVEADAELKAKYKPTCTEDEFGTYVWAASADGKPTKEEPLKMDDHGMDATRYAVAYINGQSSALATSSQVYSRSSIESLLGA